MKNRLGFTLAEVLITLVIIGVIAAMTIPALLQNTNQQEYITAYKKAVSMINQAVTLNYALDGYDAGDIAAGSSGIVGSLFSKRMNINKSEGETTFYTADGMKFGLSSASAGCTAYRGHTNTTDLMAGTGRCYQIDVDVNGDKGPNRLTSGTDYKKGEIGDQFTLYLYPDKAVPGGDVMSQILYAK